MCQTCVPMSCVSTCSQCFHAPIWSFLAASPPAVHEASLLVTAPSKPETRFWNTPKCLRFQSAHQSPLPGSALQSAPKCPLLLSARLKLPLISPWKSFFFVWGGLGPWPRRRSCHGLLNPLIRNGHPSSLFRHGCPSPRIRRGRPSSLLRHGRPSP